MQEVVPLLVASGIEAGRSEEKRGTIITLLKSPTDDATDATFGENPTGKPDTGGDIAESDATVNATNGPDAIADATPNRANGAEGGISGNSGIRFGGISGTASFDVKPGEDAAVAEHEACRTTISSEEEQRRVRKLVREGMAEEWALREVLPSDHPLDCECDECP